MAQGWTVCTVAVTLTVKLMQVLRLVAINAQYHDYCKLFEKWFGKGNFDDMIFESAIDFWFDDVDFGEDKLWKYFNELK